MKEDASERSEASQANGPPSRESLSGSPRGAAPRSKMILGEERDFVD